MLSSANGVIAQYNNIPLTTVGQLAFWDAAVVDQIAAGGGANYQLTVARTSGAGTVRTYADGTVNRLSYRVSPRV